MGEKEKKSFKKYASKHLASKIQNRRMGAKIRKEKIERSEAYKKRQEKSAAREEKEHVDHLDALKEADPQFYSYLEEEDPTLLQFGQPDMDVVDENEGSDAETDVDENEQREDVDDDEEAEVAPVEKSVTKKELEATVKAISGKNYKPAVVLFLSAVRALGYRYPAGASGAALVSQSTRKFDEAPIIRETVVSTTKAIAGVVGSMVTKGKDAFSSKGRRVAMRSFFNGLNLILSNTQDNSVLLPVLQQLVNLVPFMHLVHGVTKAVLKHTLHLCANQDESVRLAAYMVVRAVATRSVGTRSMYQSLAFKGIFLVLVRNSHTYNIHTLPVVSFIMNAVVDLYGTDMEAAYQHTFVYIRQLAIYLRAVLQQQSEANVRTVFNWQYVNSLRTWGLVVSTYSDRSQLWPLIHPVVQLGLGLMDLFSSPRMFPMHLHVAEMLNRICARANVYIPVSTYLLRVLTSPAIAIKAHAASNRPSSKPSDRIDVQFILRIRKSQAKDADYHISMWTSGLYLLTEHLATFSHVIGFPEAFWVVLSTLKRQRREVKHPKIASTIASLLKAAESTQAVITSRREHVNFGPCDAENVAKFEQQVKAAGTPLQQYHKSVREVRVNDFAAKQSFVEKRTTLDSLAEEGGGRKRGRPTGGHGKRRH